jgi:hypothetical protein
MRHTGDPADFHESELEGAARVIELDPEVCASALEGASVEGRPGGEVCWSYGQYVSGPGW